MPSASQPVATFGLRYRAGANPAHTLDMLAAPPAPGETRAAVIWVHGGGWYMGERQPNPNDMLAERGYVTFAISYRFSQEAIFPAQLHDVRSAIRFVRANAGEFGIDPGRIGIWGHSAGGHLGALAATIGDEAEIDDPDDDASIPARVQAAVPLSAPTDFVEPWSGVEPGAHIVNDEHPENPVAALLGQRMLPPADVRRNARLASATVHASRSSAPMLIVHSVEDEVVPVDRAGKLNAALSAAGAVAELVELPGVDHNYERVVGLSPSGLSPVQRRVIAHFDRYLRGG